MTGIRKTLVFMEPVEYHDGHGFRTVVESHQGAHFLISEVHRKLKPMDLNETLIFSCDPAGNITGWTERYGADSTMDAIAEAHIWCTDVS